VTCVDARGHKREARVTRKNRHSLVLETEQGVYLTPETRLTLRTAEGGVLTAVTGLTPLPARLRLRPGERFERVESSGEPVVAGRWPRIGCDCAGALAQVQPEDPVYFDDGRLAAEVTDAAMGARAECVMLNKGAHVVDAVRTLDDILRRMQLHRSKKRPLLRASRSWNRSSRRPAVDPDDHHVFVSLGCAAENLVQAARAHGLLAAPSFDATRERVHVALSPAAAQASPLFQALASRQCTRGDYDGPPYAREDLALLQAAGTSGGARLWLLMTDRPAMEQALECIVQDHTAQLADPVFVSELKSWIRFNPGDAVHTRDGLFSLSSGNPSIPTWLGERAFGRFFTAQGENDQIARQPRSSAGVAVFVGAVADKAHWVEVGRAYERFALQATALGIRNAFLNQPVEVAAVRSPFAAALGLPGQRPDLVVRFGRGPTMPRSLRRPVDAVLV